MCPFRGERRGFTLVELMVASAIFALVLGGVTALFLGVERMTRTAVAEAELSIRARELREKLLFHLTPAVAGRPASGLLSGEAYDESALGSEDWLNPGGLVDRESSERTSGAYSNELYYVTTVLTANGQARRERVVVPVFGRAQTTVAGKAFGE